MGHPQWHAAPLLCCNQTNCSLRHARGTPSCFPQFVPVVRSQVPPDCVWIEGDNAHNSVDSRYYGPIPSALLEGRVLARVWPPNQAGWMARSETPTRSRRLNEERTAEGGAVQFQPQTTAERFGVEAGAHSSEISLLGGEASFSGDGDPARAGAPLSSLLADGSANTDATRSVEGGSGEAPPLSPFPPHLSFGGSPPPAAFEADAMARPPSAPDAASAEGDGPLPAPVSSFAAPPERPHRVGQVAYGAGAVHAVPRFRYAAAFELR